MIPIAPGLRLGRYQIRSKLGAGMGEVYLADDLELGRPVAIKVLPSEDKADPTARKRLVREARAAAGLDHPHICAVYEAGEADGHVFIAMQYVEGQTLDARLRQGPLELADTLAIAVQIVDALCQAHQHGILHRDIKPANVMLTARGQGPLRRGHGPENRRGAVAQAAARTEAARHVRGRARAAGRGDDEDREPVA